MLPLPLLLLVHAVTCDRRSRVAGPPEEAEGASAADQSDLFVLVRTDAGGAGYINMK
jgi:hypothetical protein